MPEIDTSIRDKRIVELREKYKMSFQKIGEIYGISRQMANVIYHKQNPDAPRRPRRFKKEENNADCKN